MPKDAGNLGQGQGLYIHCSNQAQDCMGSLPQGLVLVVLAGKGQVAMIASATTVQGK